MSSARGSTCRTRPQKHQNRTAFKNNLHDTSKKTKIINSLEITGVCERCQGIIEWKIKYKKYKLLTAPKKCVGCDQKTVKHAYRVLCNNCSTEKKLCAKCNKPFDLAKDKSILLEKDKSKDIDDNRLSAMLKTLPERKRRTILRYLKNQEGQPASNLETLYTEMNKLDLEDEDRLCDLSDCDSESICGDSDCESHCT